MLLFVESRSLFEDITCPTVAMWNVSPYGILRATGWTLQWFQRSILSRRFLAFLPRSIVQRIHFQFESRQHSV